ncbi:family 16 glycosylhydrolase [Alteromonas sp. KUL49]|uniref:family 16 glycosylhydrolase n=1 Tax=Alteromonas sp. KUL49 TaxID=2480798 RepID=UPI001F5F34DD|nr:family 16 glycosylhydrolase [Alteromonas sp. KUL49]
MRVHVIGVIQYMQLRTYNQWTTVMAIFPKYHTAAPNTSARPISMARALTLLCTSACMFSCAQEPVPNASEPVREIANIPAVLPHTDQANEGGWIYNAVVSDEFEGDTVDEDRWFIVGKFEDGKPVYKHPDKPNKWVWKGRAPSQFSGRNYRLEDGKLVLETRWEPDFPFEEEVRKPHFGEALPYENITTACFISRKFFTYGYIEIKSKAADAEVTSAFWSMGDQIELDFFEQFGSHRMEGKAHLDRELWWSLRDWQRGLPEAGKPVYTEHKDLGFNVADEFHIYGFEWDENGFKYYVDGELISTVTPDDVRQWALENRDVPAGYDGWIASRPISLWLDQETFPWNGVPDSLEDLEMNSPVGEKEDGVVDFEIEYVRVWQKPQHILPEHK